MVAALAVGGVWLWRTPSAALVRLKLALDRHDRSAVERALDTGALVDDALARLVDDGAGEPGPIRLALHGEGGWLPAMTSAREYLRIRLGTTLERLVEQPETALRVSWAELQLALATLQRFGAVAFFVFELDTGGEYAVRMRQTRGRWRIVSLERDGVPLLVGPLGPGPTAAAAPPPMPAPSAAATEGIAEAAIVPPVEEMVPAPPEPAPTHEAPEAAAHLDEAAALARANPLVRPRRPRGRPFARRLDGSTWTVQVAATTDVLEAELAREWFAERGEAAFVSSAEVRGQLWQRVLVGRYATSADAERTVARLSGRDQSR
jgi:hypothetical protein